MTNEKAIKEFCDKLLAKIEQCREWGHESNTILEGIEADLTFPDMVDL